jgi:hypothetical protein
MAEVSFNPLLTTNAQGSFSVASDGFVAGVIMDDPATRNEIAGGVVATGETYPMYGGLAMYELVNVSTPGSLGPTVGRADAQSHLAGFTVFNQGHAGITTPQSPVPLFASGMSINFVRLGSGIRIALPISGSLNLSGDYTNQQVSWDYTAQQIVAYDSVAALPVKILQVQASGNKTVNAANIASTGFVTWSTSGAIALVQL